MTRKLFLTMCSVISFVIGVLALTFPSVLLEGKGVTPNQAINVWMSEVGVLIISFATMAFLIRGHADSPTLKIFFLSNIITQVGLFGVELAAYKNGVITKLSGVVPNLVLHVLLVIGFIYYLKKIKN
jgi:hypothetical protein